MAEEGEEEEDTVAEDTAEGEMTDGAVGARAAILLAVGLGAWCGGPLRSRMLFYCSRTIRTVFGVHKSPGFLVFENIGAVNVVLFSCAVGMFSFRVRSRYSLPALLPASNLVWGAWV